MKQGPQNTLRALFQLYVSRSSVSSEKLPRINIDLNCKPVLKVQFLNDDNCGIIESLLERADKCYLSTFGVEKTHGLSVIIKSKAGEYICLDRINTVAFWLVYGVDTITGLAAV